MTCPGRRLLPLLLLCFLFCGCGAQDSVSDSEPAEISPAPTAFDLMDYENPVKLASRPNYRDDFSYSVYVDHVSITGYVGSRTEVEIPAKIDGVPVTVVSGSFSDSVQKVTLPEGLLHLSLSSFSVCSGLHRLTLPKSLQSLFPADPSTEQYLDLELAAGSPYFTMEDGVLFDRAMETLVYFPREKTGSYTLPDTVTAIGEYAFSCCNVEEVVLPEDLLEIRDGAFDSCVRLSSITLPKSLRTLGDAFRGCMELKTVKASPENPSFKSVDGVLYSRDMETLLVYPPARAASEFTVPETVRRGWHLPVFSQKLQTLTIPAGVEPVADFIPVDLEQTVYFKGSAEEWCNLFRGASQFPRVWLVRESADIRYEGDYGYTVENGQATLRSYTGTDTDLSLPDMLGGCPVTAVGEEALCFLSGLNWEANEQGETEGRCRTYRVTVPEGVISLGDRAFYGSNLVSVFLPVTLTELGAQVFAFCDQLENISVAAENPCFAAGDGALYSRDGTTLYVLCGRTRQEGETESVRRTGFILPSAVTAIAPGAFLSCPELDAVGVEAGSAAFAGADGVLTDLHGKTLAAYPAGALQRQIPETVETVGAYAFARSEMPDRTAYLLGNVTELGEGAFAYCKIDTVTVPEGIKNIPERAFFGSSLAELHLPAGLTSIGEDAFRFCASLETVYFGGTESEWREISMASGNEALEHTHVEFESP